ncbi:hypothetical protein G9A89_017899 [Geosiphon pyriformis]|nr:hypothetical protein G9A89_017899 [Geosiphon pyriformis]
MAGRKAGGLPVQAERLPSGMGGKVVLLALLLTGRQRWQTDEQALLRDHRQRWQVIVSRRTCSSVRRQRWQVGRVKTNKLTLAILTVPSRAPTNATVKITA